MAAADTPAFLVLGRTVDGCLGIRLDANGAEIAREVIAADRLTEWIAAAEADWAPRWVWHDTPQWYAALLADGVRVARCHDLRLCHAILRDSALVDEAAAVRRATEWDASPHVDPVESAPTLFELDDSHRPSGAPAGPRDALGEFARPRDAIAGSRDPARLRLLTAAESAGALVAAEMRAAGLPWDAAAHDRILVEVLGERRPGGGQPAKLAASAERVRAALGDPAASLDSQPKLLRSLHRVGVLVESTSRWELAEQRHPVIEPLLDYKKF